MNFHDTLMKILRDAAGEDAVREDDGFSADALKYLMPAATYSAFDFDSALLFGERMLFARPVSDMKPSALTSQLRRSAQAADCDATCVLNAPTPYLKKRLIAEGIGFVTAQGEFFLPSLLHLKPSRSDTTATISSELNATGKSVYLHMLYAEGGSTVSEMADCLSLSRAGVQRACEDLLARNLASRFIGGPTRRTAIYERIGDAEYFDEGWDVFGPAARRVHTVPLTSVEGLLRCGLSALSACTMLNPPDLPEFAIYLKDESSLAEAAETDSGPSALVHVLPYDPAPFARNGMVDPFTMLKTVGRHDERINMAMDEVKEEMGWTI